MVFYFFYRRNLKIPLRKMSQDMQSMSSEVMSYRDRVAFMTNMRKTNKSKSLYNIFSILYQVTKGRHRDSSWWMMSNCTSKKQDGHDSYISFGIWFSHVTCWWGGLKLQQNIFLATNLSEEIFFVTKNLYIATKYEFRHQ